MSLENMMLSERRQSPKTTYYMSSFVRNVWNGLHSGLCLHACLREVFPEHLTEVTTHLSQPPYPTLFSFPITLMLLFIPIHVVYCLSFSPEHKVLQGRDFVSH